MKLIVEIPKEFEAHFNQDKFKDSLIRVWIDTGNGLYKNTLSGFYECELIEMLITAFQNAQNNDAPAKQGKWLINCDGYYPYCSNCRSEPPGREMTDFCPKCGADMRWKD